MKKATKFTSIEFEMIKKFMGSKFIVTQVPRTGNIHVRIKGNDNEYFALYARDNGRFLWRCVNLVTGYPYPLNMGGPRQERTIGGYDYETYSIEQSEFRTLSKAMEYIRHYMKKYRNVKF